MVTKTSAEFGKRVKKVRTEKGIELQRLAQLVGMSCQYIVEIEDGEAEISLESAAKISVSLGVSIDVLVVSNR